MSFVAGAVFYFDQLSLPELQALCRKKAQLGESRKGLCRLVATRSGVPSCEDKAASNGFCKVHKSCIQAVELKKLLAQFSPAEAASDLAVGGKAAKGKTKAGSAKGPAPGKPGAEKPPGKGSAKAAAPSKAAPPQKAPAAKRAPEPKEESEEEESEEEQESAEEAQESESEESDDGSEDEPGPPVKAKGGANKNGGVPPKPKAKNRAPKAPLASKGAPKRSRGNGKAAPAPSKKKAATVSGKKGGSKPPAGKPGRAAGTETPVDAPPAETIKKNKWGRFEHKPTGLVFDPDTKVVIGSQDVITGKLLPLSARAIEVCKQNKWTYEVDESDEDGDAEGEEDEEDEEDEEEDEDEDWDSDE